MEFKPYSFLSFFALSLLLVFLGCKSQPEDQMADLPRPEADHGGIQLPDDFGAIVVADTLGRGRHITVNDNGDIYVRLRSNNGMGIAALRDTSVDGRADIRESFVENSAGTEVKIHNGYLYFSSPTHVMRMAMQEDELIPQGAIDTIITFPDSTAQGHSSKSFTFDGEGNIYVNIGSRSNACQEVARSPGSKGKDPCPEVPFRAAIWKFKADQIGQVQDDGEPYGIGIRNTVGLTWFNGNLYAVQHGRDDLHRFWPDLYTPEQSRDMPAEEFLMVEEGDDFGWPYCYYDPFQEKKMMAPEYGGDGKTQGRCEGIKSPLVAFPGHWGPNDLMFYTGDMFPERYKNGAFIAFHGSWNRLNFEQAGFKVAFVPMENGQPTGEFEVFADGFTGPQQVVSTRDALFRPCGLAQGPDGSIYVVDSQKGRVWRIFYYGENSGISSEPAEEMVADAGDSEPDEAMSEAMAAGQVVYDQYCKVCHMVDGSGVPNLNPPLKGTDWVTGDKERLIGVVLNGLSEPIEINGESFQNAMAPHNFLSDEQIAGVLTYIRGSFGNEAGEVTAAEVAAVRGEAQ
ncbi:PQQ-dependent sugar dehydrogenase [Flavilitoribacter nigricans]|uniref:Cytochrome C n=1 Tax=Flavilitoribacter nigricans (strain ATCC 23147 / DSM 23189 / NBRC 102662 / NCIMB 1420 / SS-2) TaxID=1122177 RepID=A0A2D0N674_FLAN2|nr:c-type cytochrome [Flavilitoribacter nigricans]PHN03659.1 cytochrome C [Flavilitoribacter nigricans DSM 23189 = NBRC 102662]